MKTIRVLLVLLCIWPLCSRATSITLLPSSGVVVVGSPFDVQIRADIDAADAIIGFGFDLTALQFVSFLGFDAGPGFADDPNLAALNDSDGIRGVSGGDLLNGPVVSGSGVLLGTLHFQATGLGTDVVSLTADDLAFNYTEGLIPEDILLTNFLPAIVDATVNVAAAPEPAGLAPLALAALLLSSWRRRRFALLRSV